MALLDLAPAKAISYNYVSNTLSGGGYIAERSKAAGVIFVVITLGTLLVTHVALALLSSLQLLSENDLSFWLVAYLPFHLLLPVAFIFLGIVFAIWRLREVR